ncbi:hypothetical protein BG004_008208 [Podila humilis]|nr:hypothetical protein BG004_008208 [Podila humilis]
MAYVDYFKKYRSGKTKNNCLDRKRRPVSERETSKEALIRTREIKLAKPEDAFMHLLMLHHPWREDVDTWIGPDGGPVCDISPNQDIPDRSEDFEWTHNQQQVIEAVKTSIATLSACRILVTGAAGTGKSAVLAEI